MTSTIRNVALVLLVVIGVATLSSVTSFAATQDYRFEVLNQPISAGRDATISVQLAQASTNKPVTDATITSQKLHMIMGSMDMPANIQPLARDDKGNYRFSANLTMYGEWILDLVATIPGEKEPIKASLKIQVVK